MRVFLIRPLRSASSGTLTGLFFVGWLICLISNRYRQFLSWLTSTELFSPSFIFSPAAGRDRFRRNQRGRDHGADAVLPRHAISVMACRPPRSRRRAPVRVRARWSRGGDVRSSISTKIKRQTRKGRRTLTYFNGASCRCGGQSVRAGGAVGAGKSTLPAYRGPARNPR